MTHYDTATIATLTATQARAVATLVKTEAARIALRDAVVVAIRRSFPVGSAEAHAALLADYLAQPGAANDLGERLKLVRELGRGGRAPTAKTLAAIFAKYPP